MSKHKWDFIKGTDKKYIITSIGKVFSARQADFLTNNERQYYYYVRIKYVDKDRASSVSIYKLLKEYFPESLENKSYYMNVERKQKDDELLNR